MIDRLCEYAIVAFATLLVMLVWSIASADETKLYLRDGTTRLICAPYVANGQRAWSCVETREVIALILKEPPDCGGAH